MPCRSDYMEPTPEERKHAAELRAKFEDLGNRATHGADVLREHLLGWAELSETLPHINLDLENEYVRLRKKDDSMYVKVDAKFRAQVNQLVDEYAFINNLVTTVGATGLTAEEKFLVETQQVQHREDDLSRLMKTFAESGDRVRLRAVLDADSALPLAPQLGFDPDEF